MGTLTGDVPRLDEHCPHKLPTSCRLTATPLCCACQDKRPHAPSYRVYIDGVGFVPRGTRWQNYCWFCKKFWTNRVAACNPPLQPSQIRIPDVPDQTAFLQRWFEFHQGYRTVKREDGSEERRALLGEPWKEVAPGELPRTLDELRTGRRELLEIAYPNPQEQPQDTNDEPSESIENTLNALLEESDSDVEDRPSPTEAQPVAPAQPTVQDAEAPSRAEPYRFRLSERQRREQAQRQRETRELHRRMYRLRQATAPSHRTIEPQAQNSAQQARLDAARARLREARVSREQAADALEAAESEVQARQEEVRRIEREQRTAENYTRVFGTREEMERLGADYESPIGGMFNRAWGRFREAEERRREGLPAPTNDPWSRSANWISPEFQDAELNQENWQRSILQSIRDRLDQLPDTPNQQAPQEVPEQGLDAGDRPEPKADGEMTKTLDCKVCYQQIADTAVLPCGHMVMCQWCADVHMPTLQHDRTALRRKKPCPVCRKKVSKRVKIFIA